MKPMARSEGEDETGIELLAVKTAEFVGRARWTRILNAEHVAVPFVIPEDAGDPEAKAYDYRIVCGEGDSTEAAINDWFGKLPASKVEAIIWRTAPEIDSEVPHDTKRRSYRVFSRFAIVPISAENKDAA